MADLPLSGKVAVVTGASRGIGRAIASRLAADGAFVVVHYRRNEQLAAEAVEEIQAAGGRAGTVQADLSQVDTVPRLLADVDRLLAGQVGNPGIDILVNNAGVNIGGRLDEVDEASFDRMFAVNVKAPFFLTKHALPRLRDGGRVMFLSSTVARTAFPAYAGYAPTKAALETLALLLAADLGSRRITVNAIVPGATDTDMNAQWLRTPEGTASITAETALGRVGTVTDVAGVAAFLAGPDGGWVTGQRIVVSGGHRL